MSTISCTIAGNSVTLLNNSFSLADATDVRSVLTFTVIDASGVLSFFRGQPVVLSDSVQGTLYSGYVQSSVPEKLSPDPLSTTTLHTVTCMDKHYLADKRTNTTNYANMYSGDIAADFVVKTLSSEGVTAPIGYRHDTTASDWNAGILSGTVSTSNLGDGDLELTTAGTTVTITEATTSDFSSGTLTNCTAASNTLTPNTQQALKIQATLPGTTLGAFMSVKIWSGSFTIANPDTFYYTVWIASSSPQATVAIDFGCSDGTLLSAQTSIFDQNGISAAPTVDLSNYAKDTWYARQLTITPLHGKTLTSVSVYFGGQNVGTYTAYFKNIYLGSQSGSPMLSTTATATNVNPPVVGQYSGYFVPSVTASIATVVDPVGSYRISNAYSIDAAKLLRSSLISWNTQNFGNSSISIKASYDGGSSWQTCTNNAALPCLPSGSNVAGLSITLQENFTVGNDPTGIPTLTGVSISLLSAANATKSDLVHSFITQSDFNTGTYSSTAADSNGNLGLAGVTRDWNDNLITSQTAFLVSGTTQSAASGVYNIACGANLGAGQGYGESRLDLAGTLTDFVLDCDLKSGGQFLKTGITYRQTAWNTTDNTYAYWVFIYPFNGSPSNVILGHGSNSGSDLGFTTIQQVNLTSAISAGAFYHIRIVVSGNHHQIYFNNGTNPIIDVIDTTYTSSGQIGLRAYNVDNVAQTATWDNFSVRPITGTWTGPSNSISSLVSCDSSVISWTELNTSNPVSAYAIVQTSVDGGSTWQNCTNQAAIPNLSPGSVSGKSVQVKVTLGSQSGVAPIVQDIVWRVLGAYPGASGTRSTIPMGFDTGIRANQSGWGTATDSQTWTKTGTGTDAISSNKMTITNTTGDVFEQLGSRTMADVDGVTRFQLSASTMKADMELRYVDANNFYRLQASTTGVQIIKMMSGVSIPMETVAMTIPINTPYRMRFRIVGNQPTLLYGNVWADVTAVEPTTWTLTATE